MNKDRKKVVVIALSGSALGSPEKAGTKVNCGKSTICTVAIKSSSFSMGFQI